MVFNPYKLAQNARNTVYKLATAAKRTGQRLGVIPRKVRTYSDVAQKVLDVAGKVRDKVAGINKASGGLLEEGVRALPFGDNIVRGANVASKVIDRAGAVVRKVRRGADTVERVRNRAMQATNQFT